MGNIKKDFENKGFYVVRNLKGKIRPEVGKLLEEIKNIGKSFDKNFNVFDPQKVRAANKKKFYKIIRYNFGLYSLAVNKEIIKIIKLLGVKTPVLHGSHVRCDINSEKNHAFDWHQDGPNILGSKKQICLWIPCSDVPTYLGSIEFIEGSHKFGVLKSKCRSGDNPMTSNNLIINDNDIPDGKKNILKIEKGEFLIFHPLLVHRSHYVEVQKKTRITAVIRYDDAADIKHRNLGYLTYLDGKNINSATKYKKYFEN